MRFILHKATLTLIHPLQSVTTLIVPLQIHEKWCALKRKVTEKLNIHKLIAHLTLISIKIK